MSEQARVRTARIFPVFSDMILEHGVPALYSFLSVVTASGESATPAFARRLIAAGYHALLAGSFA
jgi:hypothetical protein